MQRTGRLSTPRAQRVRRSRAARVIVIAVIAFLGTALFRLQVLRGDENFVRAESYRLRELPVPAPRGTIYDRHGRVVAENVPGFQIMIMPGTQGGTQARLDSMNATIEQLRPLIGLTDAQLQRARRRWERQRHLPMVLLDDAPERAVAILAERQTQFPSVVVQQYAKRRYPSGHAIAHFIGYVNEIDERDLASEDVRGYEQGRWIGKAGLERQYEKHLGGTPGKRYLEIDA